MMEVAMRESAPEIYTINDLMEILQVTRRTQQDYINKSKIKAFKIGNNWLVNREALLDFIERYTK